MASAAPRIARRGRLLLVALVFALTLAATRVEAHFGVFGDPLASLFHREPSPLFHGFPARYGLHQPATCPNAHAPLQRALFHVDDAPDAFLVSARLPGVNSQDIRVRREPGLLTVEAARAVPRGCERFTPRGDRLFRQWRLPADVRLTEVTATFENEQLRITLPRGAPKPEQPRGQQPSEQPRQQPPQQQQQQPREQPQQQQAKPPSPPPHKVPSPSLEQLERVFEQSLRAASDATRIPEREPTEPVETDADGEPRFFHTALLEERPEVDAVQDEEAISLV
jgi:HSP20 family molecular chaperone IbpA